MSFADLSDRLGVAGAFGALEYRSSYSPRIIGTSVIPRAVLQAAFFVLLGRLLGGPYGSRYAFVGAVGFALVAATVVRLPDVLAVDKQEGTSYRLRTAALPHLLVTVCRSWPYLAEALVSMGAVLTMTSLLVGQGATALRLVPFLPVFALATLTIASFGLAGAAFSVGRRADVLVGNLLSSVLLASCHVVAATSAGWLDAMSQFLPLRHALISVRAGLDGRSPLPQAGYEALVGVGWFLVAGAILSIQSRRAIREGTDDHE